MEFESVGKHEERAGELGRLVDEKNRAYGDSFTKSGRILRLLYPDGIAPEQYDHLLFIVRVLDKLFRLATRKNAFGENPAEDIGGYALLELVREEKKEDAGIRESRPCRE